MATAGPSTGAVRCSGPTRSAWTTWRTRSASTAIGSAAATGTPPRSSRASPPKAASSTSSRADRVGVRRVLLAVDAATADLTPDDRLLAAALQRRRVEVRPVRWGTEVRSDGIVVVRSTWDYVDRPDEFVAWLDHLDAQGVSVVNPTPLLRWNLHK